MDNAFEVLKERGFIEQTKSLFISALILQQTAFM